MGFNDLRKGIPQVASHIASENNRNFLDIKNLMNFPDTPEGVCGTYVNELKKVERGLSFIDSEIDLKETNIQVRDIEIQIE